MTIEKIENHAARAVARLASQFRSSASHRGVLNAFSAQVQEIEDAIFDLLLCRSLADATGDQLDKIGGLVGAAREGRTDPVYRQRLQAQILINRRSGEIDTLIEIAELLIPGVLPVLVERYPASLTIDTASKLLADVDTEARLLKSAKPGGVRLVVLYQPQHDDNTLILDSQLPTQAIGDSTDLSVGGRMAGAT